MVLQDIMISELTSVRYLVGNCCFATALSLSKSLMKEICHQGDAFAAQNFVKRNSFLYIAGVENLLRQGKVLPAELEEE